MQSRKDAALRKLVTDARLPIKTRRAALGEMQAPSRAFLTTLANDSSVHAWIRLDASRKLPEVEQRIVAARARRLSRPDEETKRREIDRILAEAAKELGIDLDDAVGPEPLPESAEPIAIGSPAAPDEILSDTITHTQSEQPTVRLTDSPEALSDTRQELLTQGRALAAAVLVQYERFTRCPHNLQESQRLEYLQGQFLKWEREAQMKVPGIDFSEFANPRLRPAPPKVDFSRLDRQLMVPEMLMLPRVQPRQARGPRDDGSMWAAAGPGI